VSSLFRFHPATHPAALEGPAWRWVHLHLHPRVMPSHTSALSAPCASRFYPLWGVVVQGAQRARCSVKRFLFYPRPVGGLEELAGAHVAGKRPSTPHAEVAEGAAKVDEVREADSAPARKTKVYRRSFR